MVSHVHVSPIDTISCRKGYSCLGHNLYAAMGSISSGSDISEGDGVYLWFALEFLQLDNRLLKVLEPKLVSDA